MEDMNKIKGERLCEIQKHLREAFNSNDIKTYLFDNQVQFFVKPMHLDEFKKEDNVVKSRIIFFKLTKEACYIEVHAFRAGYGLLRIDFNKDIDSTELCYAVIIGTMKHFCEDAYDDCKYKSYVDWFKGTSTNCVFDKMKDFSKEFLKA